MASADIARTTRPAGRSSKSPAVERARREQDEQVRERLQGVDLPPKPASDIPRVPLDLADLDDPRLMRLFVKLTRFQDYFSGQLAKAEIKERAALHVLEVARATRAISIMSGGDEKITAAKEQAKLDPEVQELQRRYDVHYNKVKLMRVMYESMERNANLVSRELTRRVGRRETNESRAHRWGGGS